MEEGSKRGGGGGLSGADVGSLFLIGVNMIHCLSGAPPSVGA